MEAKLKASTCEKARADAIAAGKDVPPLKVDEAEESTGAKSGATERLQPEKTAAIPKKKAAAKAVKKTHTDESGATSMPPPPKKAAAAAAKKENGASPSGAPDAQRSTRRPRATDKVPQAIQPVKKTKRESNKDSTKKTPPKKRSKK